MPEPALVMAGKKLQAPSLAVSIRDAGLDPRYQLAVNVLAKSWVDVRPLSEVPEEIPMFLRDELIEAFGPLFDLNAMNAQSVSLFSFPLPRRSLRDGVCHAIRDKVRAILLPPARHVGEIDANWLLIAERLDVPRNFDRQSNPSPNGFD